MNAVVGILIQCDTNFDFKICRSVACISWYSDSALYLEYYLMNKPYSFDIGLEWHKDWPYQIYKVIDLYFMIQ